MDPQPLTNPLLDPQHLAMLAQQAQQTAPPVIRPPSAESGPPPLMSGPGMTGLPPSMPSPTMLNVSRIPTQMDTDKAELARKINTGSGIDQISGKIQGAMPNHPLVGKLLGGAAQGLATLGDVGLRAVAPQVDLALPGTSLHHLTDLGQGNRQVAADEANTEKEAQTKNLELQPELRLGQQALAHERQNEIENYHAATISNNAAKLKSTLAAHGFAPDEENEGQLRPLKYEEMSETQQAVHDLKGAQEEQAKASADLKKAQNDPSSPTYQMAQARLQSAQQAHSIALQRLGLSEKQFELRSQGTIGGAPAEGAMISDSGKPIGTAFQQNVRPTGQERNKGDMANSAAQQIGDMKSIIAKRPDIFGPGAGRGTDLQVWLGSQDPDAQRFRAARTIAGDHLAGTFGGRSEAALHALDNALGQFKDNPKAAMAGLDQLAGATGYFQKAGTVKTVGSKAETQGKEPARPQGVPANAAWNPQGNNGSGSWRIP